jgi:Rha family phage regulatory protein
MNSDWVYLNPEQRPITTSVMVSEVFGELHRSVLAKIEMLDFNSEFFIQNFQEIKYFNDDWELKTAYEMTRDGFGFISIDFTGREAAAFSTAFIESFDNCRN